MTQSRTGRAVVLLGGWFRRSSGPLRCQLRVADGRSAAGGLTGEGGAVAFARPAPPPPRWTQ